MLLLLVLWLLEGAYVVTPILTNLVGIRGVGKSEAKWGGDISWSKFQNFFFLFLFCVEIHEDK
jgi:hypothetical protein